MIYQLQKPNKIQFKMKSITLLFSIFTTSLIAQNYTVSSFVGGYSDLSNPQVLTNTVWDDPELIIAAGFDVKLNGVSFDSLLISDLGCTVTGLENGVEIGGAINPSLTDIIDRGYDAGVTQSSITYTTDGFVGNRILKIQWKNVGSYGEYDLDGNSMYINFQLWMYEQGDYIEVRYGASSISDANVFYEGESGVGVVIASSLFGSSPNDVYLTGSTNFPSQVSSFSYMTGTPQNGQIYRFSPSLSIGVDENSNRSLNVFPNPCRDVLNIKNAESGELKVFDINGRVVVAQQINAMEQIEVSDLVSGSYLVVFEDASHQVFRQTFIKE